MNVLGYPHAFGMYGCSLWMQVASSQAMVLTLTPRILALPLVSTGPFTLALFWQKSIRTNRNLVRRPRCTAGCNVATGEGAEKLSVSHAIICTIIV